MIKSIVFTRSITVPTRKQSISYYNAAEDGGEMQVEETPVGFTFTIGKTIEGKFVPDGRRVRVPWGSVASVTEQATPGKGEKK